MSANLTSLLQQNPYPGRGIAIGLHPGSQHLYLAYFIMGRSANSRNRVFTQTETGVVTEAANPATLVDPSLIIYAPVRRVGEVTVVTNGDQTDTIGDALEKGGSFEDALRTRTFEPDAPNYTPRISAMAKLGFDGFSYRMSILRAAAGGASVQRFFWEYPQPVAGQGHFVHTYQGNGDPLPSFAGEPVAIAIDGSLDEFGSAIWNSLDGENKVSLFVRSIALDGSEITRLYNQYQKV